MRGCGLEEHAGGLVGIRETAGGGREGEGSLFFSLDGSAKGWQVLAQRKGELQGGEKSEGEQEEAGAKMQRQTAGPDRPLDGTLVFGGRQRPRLRQQEERRQHGIDDRQQAPDLACKQGWDWKVRGMDWRVLRQRVQGTENRNAWAGGRAHASGCKIDKWTA